MSVVFPNFSRLLANDGTKQIESLGSSLCCCLALLPFLSAFNLAVSTHACPFAPASIQSVIISYHVFAWGSLTIPSTHSSFF